MAKFAVENVEEFTGSGYPAPFDEACKTRHTRRLTDLAGISQFGVNQVRLEPGAWSSQRHWHTHEDEFVLMLEGEAVLVSDDGETHLRPGDAAGFPAGEQNGHHLQNRSDSDCVFLAIGSRSDADGGEYPDIDLRARPGRYTRQAVFTNKRDEPLA